jgi:hypothetical protein
LDWKAVAGQTDSTALIANRAQREQVKADLDRVNRLITKRSEQMKNPDLADETVKLYAEQIVEARTRSTQLSTEQDRLQKLIDHEASKTEALYSPEALLELLKSGSATNDLRLRLSAEIRKRILRLDCVFGTGLVVYLRFVNGADKMIDFRNDEPILAHQRSWERGELK